MFKELTVEEWTSELDRGLDFRRRYGLEDSWAELEALFYNVHGTNIIAGPNIIASTGDSLLSELTVPQPYVSLQARQPGLGEGVKVLENIDNTLIQAQHVAEEMETANLHAFLWGKGIIKIGYDSEFGWDPKYEFGQQEGIGFTLTQFDKKGRRLEFASRTKPGTVWFAACLPHDIIVPYGTFRLRNAEWIAHRIVRHVDDVKADSKYENTKNLVPTMSREDFVKSYMTVVKPYRIGQALNQGGSEGDRKKVEFVEMFEIHSARTGKIKVIATGHKKFLRNGVDGLQLDGLPFVDIGYVPAARSFWVTPDAYYLKQDQAELSDIALQAQKQRRASVLKFFYNEDAIEKNELELVLSRVVGPAVRINPGGAASIRDAVMPFTAANNNPMLQNDAEYIRRGARERVGFSRNQAGEFEQSGRRTATEVREVGASSDTRLSRRQLVGVARGYIDLIRKTNEIIFAYWTTPRWTEVGGEWVKFLGPELRGDYAYTLSFSSEPVPSLERRKMIAMQLYAQLSQDPFIDQMKLREYLVGSFNDVELRELFTRESADGANLRIPMSQPGMSQGGGRPAANGGQGQQKLLS